MQPLNVSVDRYILCRRIGCIDRIVRSDQIDRSIEIDQIDQIESESDRLVQESCGRDRLTSLPEQTCPSQQ